MIVFLRVQNLDFFCIRGRLKSQAVKNFALITGDLTGIVPSLKVISRSTVQPDPPKIGHLSNVAWFPTIVFIIGYFEESSTSIWMKMVVRA